MDFSTFITLVYAGCATGLAVAAWGVSRFVKNGWRHVLVGCLAGLLIAPYGTMTEMGEYFFPSGLVLFYMARSVYNPFNDSHLLLTMTITTIFCAYGSWKYQPFVRHKSVRLD